MYMLVSYPCHNVEVSRWVGATIYYPRLLKTYLVTLKFTQMVPTVPRPNCVDICSCGNVIPRWHTFPRVFLHYRLNLYDSYTLLKSLTYCITLIKSTHYWHVHPSPYHYNIRTLSMAYPPPSLACLLIFDNSNLYVVLPPPVPPDTKIPKYLESQH